MTELPIRRVLMVLAFYAVGAWLVLEFGEVIRRMLMLPSLFETLLKGGLVLGVPLAIAVAWRYPQLGVEPTDASPRSDSRPRD